MYATDITAQTKDQLNSFPVPDPLNTVVVYPIAVARGDNTAGGQAFVNFVLSPAGQAVLASFNFLPPTPAPSAAAQPTPGGGGGSGGQSASASGNSSAAAPVPGVASSTFSPSVSLTGLVGTPRCVHHGRPDEAAG